MSDRDPRLDPQPGDSLAKKSVRRYLVRRVDRREGSNIWYLDNNGHAKNCWLTTWQAWAKDAEITKGGGA